jgi:hypothetical protein
MKRSFGDRRTAAVAVLALAFVIGGMTIMGGNSVDSSTQSAGFFDSVAKLLGYEKKAAEEGTKVTGNGTPSGQHYNLNLIGVQKDKTADMTGNQGHRIFAPLSGKCRIDLSEGDFQVLDANCTKGSAAFQLPNPDPDGDGITTYSVYVRALGKPGGSAKATSCATDGTDTWCSTESVVVVREGGKSTFINASKELLTVCMDTDGDSICDTRSSLFGDDLLDYLWEYDNQGLKLAQFRFYEVETEVGTTP